MVDNKKQTPVATDVRYLDVYRGGCSQLRQICNFRRGGCSIPRCWADFVDVQYRVVRLDSQSSPSE